MERVRHAIRETSEDGHPQLTADNYRAVFDEAGFRLLSRAGPEAASCALAFRTRSISLRERAIEIPPVDPAVCGNTAQRLLDPTTGILEHCETRSEGVEVTWVIPSRPPGLGDISIRTQVDGMACVGSTESGHQFSDASGTGAVHIGRVVVVDSLGRRWDTPSEVTGNTLITTVPAGILDCASYPLAVDPIVGPEFEVPGVFPVPKEGNNHGIAVASDGSDYLVVWVNQLRLGSPGEIWAARVRASDGIVLDPLGTLVFRDPQSSGMSCSVAYGKGEFLVVWDPYKSPIARTDIRGARVRSVDGMLVPPGPFEICIADRSQTEPKVAFNGTNFLVVWKDHWNSPNTGNNIYGSLVHPGENASVAPFGVPISIGTQHQTELSVASDGSDFLVVWRDDRNSGVPWNSQVYGARVDGEQGQVLDASGIVITQGWVSGGPAIAFQGNTYVVVWTAEDLVFGDNVKGRRILPNGMMLDPTPLDIGGLEFSSSATPTLSSNGAGLLALWNESGNSNSTGGLYATRFIATAEAVAFSGTVRNKRVGAKRASPVLSSNGHDYFLAWKGSLSEYRLRDSIMAARIGGDPESAALSDAILVSRQPNAQRDPRVACCGDVLLLIWREDRFSSNMHLFGARLRTSDGTVLDPAGIPGLPEAGGVSLKFFDVASDGNNFCVAWSESSLLGNPVKAVRIHASTGLIMDSASIVVREEAGPDSPVALASNGKNYLVVWLDKGTKVGRDVYGARIEAEWGTVLDLEPIPISYTSSGGSSDSLLAAPTTTQTSSLTNGGFTISPPLPISLEPSSALDPDVASDGKDYVVVWRYKDRIAGVRVIGLNGFLDAHTRRILVDKVASLPAVTYGGNGYLLCWSEPWTHPDLWKMGLLETGLGEAAGLLPENANTNTGSFGLLEPLYGVKLGGMRLRSDASPETPHAYVGPLGEVVSSLAVASNGSEYLLCWSGKTLSGARCRFDVSSGSLSFSQTFLVDPNGSGPSLAAVGTLKYVCCYHELDSAKEVVRTKGRFISLQMPSPDLHPLSDTGASNTDNVTGDNTPTLSGTAPAQAAVVVYDGSTYLGTATADAAGNWTMTTGMLSDGLHSLVVQGSIVSGFEILPSEPLKITVDTTAPSTSLVAASAGGFPLTDGMMTPLTSIQFTFIGVDNGALAGFECSLDGAPFNLCSSPTTYIGLSPGKRVFRVRAVDLAGNVDPFPSTFTWFIGGKAYVAPALEHLISKVHHIKTMMGHDQGNLTAPLYSARELAEQGVEQKAPGIHGKLTAFLKEVDAQEKLGKLSSQESTELRRPAGSIRDVVEKMQKEPKEFPGGDAILVEPGTYYLQPISVP